MLGYTTNFEVHSHIEVAIGVDTTYLILIYDRLFSSVGNFIIEEAAVYYLETRIYKAAPREEITTLHIYLSKVPATSRPPTPTPTPKLPISHPNISRRVSLTTPTFRRDVSNATPEEMPTLQDLFNTEADLDDEDDESFDDDTGEVKKNGKGKAPRDDMDDSSDDEEDDDDEEAARAVRLSKVHFFWYSD